jgi:IrrE N-terminal-like domain
LTSKEQLIKKFCARWDSPLPQMAMDQALRSAFPTLQDMNPPVHLGRLAAQRGVEDILKKDLRCDGTISRTATGSYVICVNRKHPEVRIRFTTAHELGHTFFFDVDPEIRERVRDGNPELNTPLDPEEIMCNYAAAEILMPRRQIAVATKETGIGAEALLALAKKFKVSTQAITRRVLQTAPARMIVVQWERQAQSATYVSNWICGLTSRRRGNPRGLVIQNGDPAFKFCQEKNAYRGRMWLSLDGPMDGYFVDLVAWQSQGTRRVLTVFVLERNPGRFFAGGHFSAAEPDQMPLF